MDKEISMEEKLLTMIVFQLIELNRLLKKLNYISGTTDTISLEEISEEMVFLGKYIDCVTEKGKACPIRGLVRKIKGKEEET
jgi:hypothetical protein